MTDSGPVTFSECSATWTDLADDPVVALDRVPDSEAVLESVPGRPPDENVVFAFVHEGFVGFLNTAVAEHAPCPACVLYHSATGTDVALPGHDGGSTAGSTVTELRRGDVADALDAVSGEENYGRAVLLDPETGETLRDGTVWPHPACSHEGFPATTEPDASLSPSAELLRDASFGLVRRVAPVPGDDDWTADLSVVASRSVNPAYPDRSGRVRPFLHASGTARSAESARLRATMEGLERCTATAPDLDPTVATGDDLGSDAVPPTEFVRYADEQYAREEFPYVRYDPATSREWVRCERPAAAGSRYVPADFVRLVPGRGPAPPLVQTTTSGCAAHFSKADAVRNATTELLERDAALHHWYAQRTPPRVRRGSLPEDLAEYARTLDDSGYDVYVVDATRRPPFACVAVFLVGTDQQPAVVSAAGCDPDPAEAARDAFHEAADIYRSMAATDPPAVPDAAAVTGTDDHLAFYQRADRAERLREWLDGGPVTSLDAVEGEPNLDSSGVADVLADRGVRLLVADLTSGAVAAHGGTVVRVLSPDLLPMTFGHGRERLVGPGGEPALERATDLPHPFA